MGAKITVVPLPSKFVSDEYLLLFLFVDRIDLLGNLLKLGQNKKAGKKKRSRFLREV